MKLKNLAEPGFRAVAFKQEGMFYAGALQVTVKLVLSGVSRVG